MSAELAVVIPYYKRKYFDATLKSFAAQTNKNFIVYVGNDCSPDDPIDIINKYASQITIIYKRFDSNLGGRDLVGQWERCIELTNGETWLWLFSDDDVVGPKCVELFYEQLSKEVCFDIYHFNVVVINEKGEHRLNSKLFPDVISYEQLFYRNGKGKLPSFVVEYIFSRAIYEKKGGFESFPFAWGSDMATWCKFSQEKGIKTIEGDCVYWRGSDLNITPNTALAFKKCMANVQCVTWYKQYFISSEIKRKIPVVFFYHLFHYSNYLTNEQLKTVFDEAARNKVFPKMLGCILSNGVLLKILHLFRGK